jgi:hypothetical protein
MSEQWKMGDDLRNVPMLQAHFGQNEDTFKLKAIYNPTMNPTRVQSKGGEAETTALGVTFMAVGGN